MLNDSGTCQPAAASRKRVRDVLQGRVPDQVPIDLGSSPTTGMHCLCVAEMRSALGLEDRPVKVHEPYQMLGLIEDDLADAIGVDTALTMPDGSIFGFPPRDWKPFTTPWGQSVLVPGKFETTGDGDGGLKIYPQGDRSAEPAAHMPATGYFFDAIIRQKPIDEDNLDVQDNLEEFTILSDDSLDRCVKAVDEAEATGRSVFASLPGAALGDIALVPGTNLIDPKGIRDISEWYMSTVIRKPYVEEIFDRQTEIALENMRLIHERVGDRIDAVWLCGTDFGTQESTFCSPEAFRELYFPRYRRMCDWIHQHTQWKVFKHSCGSIVTLLDAFVDCGFDIVNPVQCSARGMEPRNLKQKWGGQLVFWGGGIDTQQTLPFGTPEDVRAEVLERCEVFSENGGFVFNAIHNVQARTPVSNILAMYNAVHEFNGTGVRLG